MRLFSRPDTAVLVVCTANVCRSPMAEGLLRFELAQRGLQRKIAVDSAGTHATQSGRRADQRAQEVCLRAGIDLRKCRARQVRERDFSRFNYVLAMDQANQEWLLETCPASLSDRISLLGAWTPDQSALEIPDPYYANVAAFEEVLDLLRGAITGFVDRVTR